MTDQTLDVRLDGFSEPVGELTSRNWELSFSYAKPYIEEPASLPLSLTLPISEQAYSDIITRPFFDNFLQERDGPLRQIMAKHRIARADIAGLLYHLGADCAGAVSVLPKGHPPTKVPGKINNDYDLLSANELEEIVVALFERKALPNDMLDPSPLAGVQSKISILMLSENSFALPKPGTGAPTTHVLKVPDRQHPNDASLESLSLKLSKICGLDTINCTSQNIGGIPTIITERFDRLHDRGRIFRRHQEDFAQALSLSPSLKYERYGTPKHKFCAASIGQLLDSIANTDTARIATIKLTLFDLLIGNTDGHAKNHALLYKDKRLPDLAPRYDLVPTRLDPDINHELSYYIGTATKFADVSMDAMMEFMSSIGIQKQSAQKRLINDALEAIVQALAESLEPIQLQGQKKFADLIAANMRELLPKLDFPVPKEAEVRDAFVIKGGGWGTS